MKSIGSYDAKTHLPELLDRVAKGERITITKRGKPVAMLVPVGEKEADVEQIIKEMLEYRNRCGPRLGRSLSIRKLLEEGRRF